MSTCKYPLDRVFGEFQPDFFSCPVNRINYTLLVICLIIYMYKCRNYKYMKDLPLIFKFFFVALLDLTYESVHKFFVTFFYFFFCGYYDWAMLLILICGLIPPFLPRLKSFAQKKFSSTIMDQPRTVPESTYFQEDNLENRALNSLEATANSVDQPLLASGTNVPNTSNRNQDNLILNPDQQTQPAHLDTSPPVAVNQFERITLTRNPLRNHSVVSNQLESGSGSNNAADTADFSEVKTSKERKQDANNPPENSLLSRYFLRKYSDTKSDPGNILSSSSFAGEESLSATAKTGRSTRTSNKKTPAKKRVKK